MLLIFCFKVALDLSKVPIDAYKLKIDLTEHSKRERASMAMRRQVVYVDYIVSSNKFAVEVVDAE